MAEDEEWTPARRQEKMKEVHAPVETLIRTARASMRDTAIAAWAIQVRTLADKVVEGARHKSFESPLAPPSCTQLS
jgi:hypothetical protein